MVKYVYTAWGDSKVLTSDGRELTDETHIGNLNPYRYRGYYYDVETGLYYLKTRYYDPITCRFVTIDDLSYLDPETINGLNLYAYCANNPIMYVDPTGQFLIGFLIGLGIAALTLGVVNTAVQFVGDFINYAITGKWTSGWEDYLGAFTGGLFGGVTFFLTGGNLIATFGVMNGVETLITGLLTNATGKTDYGFGELVIRTLISVGMEITTAYLFGGTKVLGITLGRNSYMAVWKSGLTKLLRGIVSKMSFKVMFKGLAGFLVLRSVGSVVSGILSGLFSWIRKKYTE